MNVKTGERFVFAVLYNGPAGASYFNMTSGMVEGIVRGREYMRPRDTKLATGSE